MVVKPLTIFLIVFCLISSVFSAYVEKSLSIGKNPFEREGEGTASYKLNFASGYSMKDYVRVKITKDPQSTPNLLIFISKNIQCDDNRISMGVQTYESINLFFLEEHYSKSKKELYLCVKCQSEDDSDCNYDINIYTEDQVELNIGEQISYYVDELSTKIDFKILYRKANNLRNLATLYDYVTFWIKGKDIKKTTLKNDKEAVLPAEDFDYGRMYIDDGKNDFYELTVESKEGDFVTVGSLGIEDYISQDLKLNDLEIMGILNNELDKVCFPLVVETEILEAFNETNIAQVNGIVYTKKASVFTPFKGQEGEVEGTTEISDGLIFEHIIIDQKSRSFCITYRENDNKNKNIIFSLQFTSAAYKNYDQYIIPPQLPGVIYSHFLPKGAIGVYRGMKVEEGWKEINYNMKSLKGYPDMYFNRAIDFPAGQYKYQDLNNFDNPHHANRMSVYNFYLNDDKYEMFREFNSLTPQQPLIIVHCLKGDNQLEMSAKYCQFETSIFSDKDRINLIEKKTFSQYLLTGEKDSYTINIENEENLFKVYLDVIVFSGDVNCEIDSKDIKKKAHKYYLSNKIFYSYTVQNGDEKIDFSVEAQKKSFYLVVYELVRNDDDSKNTNKIDSGFNYIQSVFIGEDADFMKYFEIENTKYDEQSDFLINLYSQNCQFVVSRNITVDGEEKEDYLRFYDSYSQLIIDSEDSYHGKDKYRFKVDIISDDVSTYNKKLCMIYVTGLELSNSESGSERTISVTEGVPQYFIFTNSHPFIKYTYFVSDRSKEVIINFNLPDKGTFNVKITHHYNDVKDEQLIFRNSHIVITKKELEEACLYPDEVCPIDIFIRAETVEKERKLETTIYQVDGAPIYLEKNAIKQDILFSSVMKRYYLDVGPEEEGEITIDYIRGSGYIYADIVRKNENEPLKEADWRGVYKFPKTKEESSKISYETYLKQLKLTKSNTNNDLCENGCYILITVVNSVYDPTKEDEDSKLVPYRITITPRILPKGYETSEYLIPKVKMAVNQFVIGNIYESEKLITSYYTVNLPYESEYVIIDWQADSPSLFVDVGKERPGTDEADHDFHFYSEGHDDVYRIEKEKIIAFAKEHGQDVKDNSIRNINLTLGIWTNTTDTLYTSLYAFKIFMPPVYTDSHYERNVIEIIHIRSDQKVQCKPKKDKDGKIMCLFAVIFDEGDIDKSLVVYPRAQMENLQVSFTGSLVDAQEIERNDLARIVEYMKNPDDQFSSKGGKKYLYYGGIEKGQSLLFSVEVEQETIIEVLSSIYTYTLNQTFVPNPSTPQVFALGNKTILFNFETTRDLLINFVSISGTGNFYWEDDVKKEKRYFMTGFEDRLTLTSGDFKQSLKKLVAQATTATAYEPDDSGFVFYISFYPRNTYHNIDQVKVGRSIELNYRDVKFPLSFFTKLSDKDISISFTFYNYYMDQDYVLKYDHPMFTIWGKVISEKDALAIRLSGERPINDDDSVKGIFDGAFGSLFLNSAQIKKFNIPEKDNPYLFFSIDLKKGQQFDYNGISMELSILREQTDKEFEFFAPENIYLNGKLSNSKDTSNSNFVYKLKTDHNKQYMRVEFAANSDYVNWKVCTDKAGRQKIGNDDELDFEYLNGRYLFTFRVPDDILQDEEPIYLHVFNEDKSNLDPRLTNYIFKYMNAEFKETFFSFPQEKDVIEYSIKEDTKTKNKIYTISFIPYDFYYVNYYIKAVYKDGRVPGERTDTIAISESDGFYLQIDNPDIDNGKRYLTFEIPNNKDISYIKIWAKINLLLLNEYILYKPLEIENSDDEDFPEIDYTKVNKRSSTKFDYDDESRQVKLDCINVENERDFEISFANKEMPNYIRITLKNKNGENTDVNKILYFSPNEEPKEKRAQLVQTGGEFSANLWITREELTSKKIYATVECQSKEEDCNYYLEFKGYRYILMDTSLFSYNYYVNSKNKRMTFSIKNDLQISQTSDQTLTLYANGGKQIRLTLGNCIGDSCLQYNFRTGAAITTKIQSHNYFELTVEATEGDYISVGSKVTFSDGRSFENVLKPNGYSITGYLTKILLPKECYTLPAETANNKNSYIIGTFYDRIAQISFKDKNFQDITEKGTQEIITTGFYSYTYNPAKETKRGYICIEFPKNNNYDIRNIPYSLQLIQPSENVGLRNFFAPQLSGSIYQRIIPKGSTVFFTGANYNVDSDDIIYNMMSTEGSPKMYMYHCTNYPLCDEAGNSKIAINEMNRMSTWHNKEDDRNNRPIDKDQYVMIVECENNEDSTTDVCQFQTSIYGNKDEIYLIEGQSFSQYISKGKSTKYIIDYSSEKSATKIHVDTLVISGDVSFDLRNENRDRVASHKYYLANKIFYSVHLDDPENTGLKRIIVEINAKVNSYYIIEYKIARGLESELSNDIYERINYLVPFSPKVEEHKKTIRVHNRRLLNSDNYLVNFYSLNCDFKILKKNIEGEYSQIMFDNNFGSDWIYEYSDDMNQEFFSYDITATDTDISNYDGKMCMLYVSGIQITKEENKQNSILMGEGIPQRISFNDHVTSVKFIYPIVDETKSLAVFYKTITAAEYSVFLQFKNSIPTRTNFSQSFTDYIDNTTLYCSGNELCSIVISISAKEIDLPPVLEVTIRQLDNVPYYIPKGVVKQDFVSGGTWLNLFTTLGKDDEGYITLDFARGSGEVYAKIVGFEDKGDDEPDWRQFKFPRKQEGTLKYEFYNEKLVFKNEDTKKCDKGCYLLISVTSSTTGHLDSGYRVHQFSITVGLYPRGQSSQYGQIIKIEPEEFVVGSLTYREKSNNNEMYEYYQISIPYDCEVVEFDWQSDSAILLVNVKDDKPSKDKSHFKKVSRSDTVFEIPKDEIAEKGGLHNPNLMNTHLTIAVYSEDYESFYGTPYSFRVHLVRNKQLNIHKITSDQKTLCKPVEYKNEPGTYNCLFMIIFGELDFIYDLMIYSKSQNPSALTYMYGKFIQNSDYDEFNQEKLLQEIPTKDVQKLNTKKLNLDFIFITLSDLHSHLFVNVVSDKNDVIELITSFKTFDQETSPNPSSVQLYAINNDNKMKLKFVTTKPLLINIVSLYGSTRYYFEDEKDIKYTLRGRDDRISLAIPASNNQESILIVENNTYIDEEHLYPPEGEMAKPRMAFYIEYYMRSIKMNLDEIYLGKTDEYAYKKSDFPLYYYSKLGKEDNSINAFFILHDIEYENNVQEFNSNDLEIKGNFIDQKTVYLLKTNEGTKPSIGDSPMKGIYDPALQVGQIFFPEKNIKDSKKKYDKSTLYLSLEKSSSSNYIVKKMRLELAAIQENCDVPVTEKLYQYGRIKNDDKNTYYYRLKVDRSTEKSYMRIQFSTNSPNIGFAINKNKNTKTNDTFIGDDKKVERGKGFITFERPKDKDIEYIYLNVFLKSDMTNKDILSNNYVFKYINSEDKDKFFEYKIRKGNANIEKEESGDEYVIKFNGIEHKEGVNIIYSLKGIEQEGYEYESLDTIALTDSTAKVVRIKDDNRDQYQLKLKKGEHEIKCFQVIAQIRDGPITEYVSYKSINEIKSGRPESKDDDDDGDTTLYAIIGVSVGLLVIVVVLVVIILIYNARNRDLMDQVNKISFVKSGAKPKDDVNLLLDNQNELE